MRNKIQKTDGRENRERPKRSFEFSWVITAETESVHYDKEYKSYLRELYEKREEKSKHETFGGYPNEKN